MLFAPSIPIFDAPVCIQSIQVAKKGSHICIFVEGTRPISLATGRYGRQDSVWDFFRWDKYLGSIVTTIIYFKSKNSIGRWGLTKILYRGHNNPLIPSLNIFQPDGIHMNICSQRTFTTKSGNFIGFNGSTGGSATDNKRTNIKSKDRNQRDNFYNGKREEFIGKVRLLYSRFRHAPLLAKIGISAVLGLFTYGPIALGFAFVVFPEKPIKILRQWGYGLICFGVCCGGLTYSFILLG